MASGGDVEQALVDAIGAIFYPDGAAEPSVIGAPVIVRRGWPTEDNVRDAVAAGSILIRVHAVSGFARNVTRYLRLWQEVPQSASTLTAALAGNVLTFGGIPALGQFVGVQVFGSAYSYAVSATDTLASIASAIAALIPGASASSATVTLPAGEPAPTETIADSGNASVEVLREAQEFAVPVWAPTPALRDAVFGVMTGALAYAIRWPLPNGETATMRSMSSTGPDDIPSRAKEWRRDLRLSIDYPITYREVLPPAVVIETMTSVIDGNFTLVSA